MAHVEEEGNIDVDVLGCNSFMATSGSALVCRLRRAFSSEDSERRDLWPEVLVRWDLSDLMLKPRLRRGEEAGWGSAILFNMISGTRFFLAPSFLAAAIRAAGFVLKRR